MRFKCDGMKLVDIRDNNFQRDGAESNAAVSKDFDKKARKVLLAHGIETDPNFSLMLGVGAKKKKRSFNLGSDAPAVLVDCKSHKWASGHNIPTAKLTNWNEAMYYFTLVPSHYRKILFVLRD